MTAIFFDNSYARLPARFYASLPPTPVASPNLLALNTKLAEELGLDPVYLTSPEGVAILAGNAIPQYAEPIAQVYAGHQFGGWSPQLGDGRAILLGELVDRDGRRRDIQLKGSGPTPFSRSADGRAPLGPVLREFIVSEAMAALGVPTTRSLAAVATGELVYREAALPGGVLTRVAASHIRVGTFQFFVSQQDLEGLKLLTDHAVARHYPEAANAADPVLALLDSVVVRQAALVAHWMSLGFIHGVMNTDNMTISGETIDYGPCAYMDAYHPMTVYSSIDRQGRYAYRNQPPIARWNLARLAQALLPLVQGSKGEGVVAAQAVLDRFSEVYEAAWLARMRVKLGLSEARSGDKAMIEELLDAMAANEVDFTLLFRHLAEAAYGEAGPARALFTDPTAFDRWALGWRYRLAEEGLAPTERYARMLTTNPLYIPRNHLVEEAISAGYEGNLAPFEALTSVLARPFEQQAGAERYASPPREDQIVRQTFCGT